MHVVALAMRCPLLLAVAALLMFAPRSQGDAFRCVGDWECLRALADQVATANDTRNQGLEQLLARTSCCMISQLPQV